MDGYLGRWVGEWADKYTLEEILKFCDSVDD
jgi:hypothetical protein